MTGGGVSNTTGMASDPQLASNDGQLYLLWLDNRIASPTSNSVALYVKQWDGSAFVEDVVGDASYLGIGGSARRPHGPGPGRRPQRPALRRLGGHLLRRPADLHPRQHLRPRRQPAVPLRQRLEHRRRCLQHRAGRRDQRRPVAGHAQGLHPGYRQRPVARRCPLPRCRQLLRFHARCGRRRRADPGLAGRRGGDLRTGQPRRGLGSHPGERHLRRRHHPHRLQQCRADRRHDQCRDHDRRRFERSDRPRSRSVPGRPPASR